MSRTEKKFIQSLMYAKQASSIIEKVLRADDHNGWEGYLVRSLYFDTLSDDDYFDKDNGLETRRKIRLRIYPPNFTTVKLEVKEKNGSSQRKRSLMFEKKDAEALIRLDYSVLLRYESDLALELFRIMSMEHYIPRCMIEYRRLAFSAPANYTRLTFDSNIKASESFFDIFASELPLHPILQQDSMILEVKYNHFLLSYVRDILSGFDKMETSASKYCLARQMIQY